MPNLNANEAVNYQLRFIDGKRVDGTIRLKEDNNPDLPELIVFNPVENMKESWYKRYRLHWISDFLPVLFCTVFWLYILWIFFGGGSLVAFILPLAPATFIIFAVLMFEVNEMMIFGFIYKKNKAKGLN